MEGVGAWSGGGLQSWKAWVPDQAGGCSYGRRGCLIGWGAAAMEGVGAWSGWGCLIGWGVASLSIGLGLGLLNGHVESWQA